MKKIIWLLPLLYLASCKDSDVSDPENGPQTYETGKSYRVGSSASEVGLKILEIYESRCPKDAICIWYGYAGVKLEVSIGTRTFTDSLYTPAYLHMDLHKTKEFSAEGRTYSVTLEDVVPYPCAGCDKPAERKAVVTVKPL